MKKLELGTLISGDTGLSPHVGGFLWEAANVCLCENGHRGSVALPGEGHFSDTYELNYGPLHANAADSFADLQEATEYGAVGVALAVFFNETGLKTKRSWKGTGVDFWLGVTNGEYSFDKKARLEISGILRGTRAQIDARLREKMEQTKTSDDSGVAAYAAVVEFSNPKILIGKR